MNIAEDYCACLWSHTEGGNGKDDLWKRHTVLALAAPVGNFRDFAKKPKGEEQALLDQNL